VSSVERVTSGKKEDRVEEYIGVIKLFAGDFAPRGWAECKGQVLPISAHHALFSILGNTYGGDGKVTFALPKLARKAPIKGSRYIICLEGLFPPRE
jgi:microcystin-dependent protein